MDLHKGSKDLHKGYTRYLLPSDLIISVFMSTFTGVILQDRKGSVAQSFTHCVFES